MNQTVNSKSTGDLIHQVLSDLDQELARFKDRDIGLRQISLKMGLHKKTLERLYLEKHKPSYQTLIKIYTFIYKENNLEKLASAIPKVISEEIKKTSPIKTEFTNNDPKALEELKNSEVALSIYVLCGSGAISTQQVKKQFGDYGLSCLNKLVKNNLIEEAPKNNFKIGNAQISLDPILLKKISVLMIDNYFRPQGAELSTENYIGFLTEGITEKAYLEILKLDRRYFEEKLKIIDDSSNSGPVRFFTIQVSDRIETGNKT